MITDTPKKTMPVAAICNGTVIDHIAAGQALKIVHLLKLTEQQKLVTLGLNLPSNTLVYKDLIKVDDRVITAEEADQIAIFAPQATLNIIENYAVVTKFKVQLSECIRGIFSCLNPKCICNQEKIATAFNISRRQHFIFLQCKYCSKSFSQHEILNF